MDISSRYLTRRTFLTAAGAGTVAAVLPRRLGAAEPTAAERANLELVNDFCAGWTVPIDWDKLGAALAADCKFRPTQTMPLVEGRDAIIAMLQDFAREATAAEFEVVDSWARGPIVVNDRVDRFALPPNNVEVPVVGVFHVVDGKIAEWSDFTF
jgi:limonene-1,2-epoxide hydrolase